VRAGEWWSRDPLKYIFLQEGPRGPLTLTHDDPDPDPARPGPGLVKNIFFWKRLGITWGVPWSSRRVQVRPGRSCFFSRQLEIPGRVT